MKRFALFLLLISFVSASHVWEFNTDGEVSIKPVVYQGNVIIASDDGSIYALSPATGVKQWELAVGGKPNEVFIFDNALITSTTDGTITRIGATGKATWTVDLNTTDYNVSYVYGAAANQNEIYVSGDNGIYSITKAGNATLLVGFEKGSTLTAPAAGSNYVIYGRGNELVRVTSATGTKQWSKKLPQGSFWLSRPVIDDAGIVYIGALDNRMHAYAASNGASAWEVITRNWVVSTPLVEGTNVYFGSNDGNVYAVDKGSGVVLWKAPTQLAVQTQPESGYMGGQGVIFTGGSDKNIYAISKDTGDVVWKGYAEGGVGSPLYYQNLVIAGSQTGAVNAHSTERACSITSPLEGQLIGLKELVVNGKYVSQSGGATVWMSINGAEWIETNTSNGSWSYHLDPSQSLATAINTISCKVVDAGGQEMGPDFTTVAINHDPSIPLSDFVIRLSSSNIIEGEEFTVYVNDGDDGSAVERFSWTLDGQEGTSDRNITLSLSEPGTYKVKVTKIGFNEETQTITVNASGVNPFMVGGALLVIIVIVWQVWVRFLKEKFAKKKKRR